MAKASLIRFRPALFTDAELAAFLKALVTQQMKGVASYSYNGQTFTFRGPQQIETAIRSLETETARRYARASGQEFVNDKNPNVIYPLGDPSAAANLPNDQTLLNPLWTIVLP